jgi:hypothetical protein
MQRVRIGLTGLGFVFVAVLLATALAGSPDSEAPVVVNNLTAPVNEATPKEPLAELGVAPGNADNSTAAAPAPAPAASPTTPR